MKTIILCALCFLCMSQTIRAEDGVLDKRIHLDKIKGTTYEVLDQISKVSGYLFVYDSNWIDNNRKVKIEGGDVSLRQAIQQATQTKGILLKVIGKHILLYRNEEVHTEIPQRITSSVETKPDSMAYILVRGIVQDGENKQPLAYASISLLPSSIGSVANQNGEFQLRIPDTLRNAFLRISYMGYIPQTIPVALFPKSGNAINIYLKTSVIPIREVIVKLVNPTGIIREMIEKRSVNYSEKPVYFTVFYREGTQYKNGFASLTEAIFKVYKPGLFSNESEKVKLLKMRKISNEDKNDSIVLKIKAGVSSSVGLDIVRNLPDFLNLENDNPYVYSKIDMTEIDSSFAHVIAFEQRSGLEEPLYKGELYIHSENSALLNAHFQINPKHIKESKDMFIVKQTKGLDITPKLAEYSVSYKAWNGKYYPNYIRGDLSFEIKKKKRLFGRATLVNTYFEMVVCKIETDNVKSIPNRETIPVKNIFSDTHFIYDDNYWGNFNIIPPEENLNKVIGKIRAKIEETQE